MARYKFILYCIVLPVRRVFHLVYCELCVIDIKTTQMCVLRLCTARTQDGVVLQQEALPDERHTALATYETVAVPVSVFKRHELATAKTCTHTDDTSTNLTSSFTTRPRPVSQGQGQGYECKSKYSGKCHS